ncbi:PhnD/SsuA/transferrin family substrate-binding protein [Herbaspirillum aquaticum]|uniref:substrate-binding domain-containing protein n=1 Tax=Herbaspirillum aquaticum TaxID=568783 RepID=UPI0024DEBD9E
MNNSRRLFIGQLGALPLLAWADAPVRIGLTPVFLDERSGFLGRFRLYLEAAIGRSVEFVQRRSYADIVEKLLNGTIDSAWICGYPYVQHKAVMQLIAVPVYQGTPTYHSYIIAGTSIPDARTFTDLKGSVFAYSDPLSNSGYLYAQSLLASLNVKDSTYFRKHFFTFGHQSVIRAVAQGLANAGSVDGYVWDSLAALSDSSTKATRILSTSEAAGFPPFVALKSLDSHLAERLRTAFQTMHETEGGRQLLGELRLDSFCSGTPAQFASIEATMHRVGL